MLMSRYMLMTWCEKRLKIARVSGVPPRWFWEGREIFDRDSVGKSAFYCLLYT